MRRIALTVLLVLTFLSAFALAISAQPLASLALGAAAFVVLRDLIYVDRNRAHAVAQLASWVRASNESGPQAVAPPKAFFGFVSPLCLVFPATNARGVLIFRDEVEVSQWRDVCTAARMQRAVADTKLDSAS